MSGNGSPTPAPGSADTGQKPGATAALQHGVDLGARLVREVLDPMKRTFVGKDEIIDLMGVCLIAAENLFLLGPPGTAKSALVQDLGRRLEGRTFEYLLTRFTEPNELFGPFDIRRLREGELVTNTEGMLPEASLIFFDELLNANSAILNSLLAVLNERVFRRGRETRQLPLLIAVGASNRLPEDDALHALFDRFLLRVTCDNVPGDQLVDVLEAGWRLDLGLHQPTATFSLEDVRRLHRVLPSVDLSAVRRPLTELVQRLRHAGIAISDRRAVKLQRPVAASALLCGRAQAAVSDLWVFRYIWETIEQQEVLAGIVKDTLSRADAAPAPAPGAQAHPRASGADRPDAESLARDLESLGSRLAEVGESGVERAYLRDRLGVLTGRCEWVEDATRREFLKGKLDALWAQVGDRK